MRVFLCINVCFLQMFHLQIRKDTSTVEHQLNLHSATSGCINRNGHLCIGLCIIVILHYLPLNYHHFLSLALISIFNVLIFVFSKNQYTNGILLYIRQTIKDNNSDNNFQIDAPIVATKKRCRSRTKNFVSSSLQIGTV